MDLCWYLIHKEHFKFDRGVQNCIYDQCFLGVTDCCNLTQHIKRILQVWYQSSALCVYKLKLLLPLCHIKHCKIRMMVRGSDHTA